MTGSLVLIAVMAVLYACGVYLLLERSMTRVLLGFLLVGNATNLLLLTMVGKVGSAPIVEDGVSAADMTDPMPEALILTAIVITFGVSAFLMALIYRSWRLERDDDVDDDLDDIAMRNPTEIGEELEATSEDTEFGPGTGSADEAQQTEQRQTASQQAASRQAEGETAK
jgi:multicomponent Na+:H+ antiporter subunit C